MCNSVRAAISQTVGSRGAAQILTEEMPLSVSSESIRIALPIFKMITHALKIQTLKN